MVDLDRTDRTILALLQKDIRSTNRAIAREVGLSESACLERVRRLWDLEVLRGARADVDPTVLGVGVQALVAVRLHRHTRGVVDAFQDAAIARPEVVALHHTTGANDFLLHVVARDMDHLRDFGLDGLTTMKDVVHLETSVIFETQLARAWPDLTASD